MRIAALLLSLSILFGAARLQGQVVRDGEWVQIASPMVTGTLLVVGMEEEVLVLESFGGAERLHVPLASVQRLAVDRPRPPGAAALRGAGFGFLIGVVVGAVSGASSGDDECNIDEGPCILQLTARQKAVGEGVVLGVVGAGLGAVIGAAIPGRQWGRVELPVQVEATADRSGRFAFIADIAH